MVAILTRIKTTKMSLGHSKVVNWSVNTRKMVLERFRCAFWVCTKTKNPAIIAIAGYLMQSVGESNPCYQDENLAS